MKRFIESREKVIGSQQGGFADWALWGMKDAKSKMNENRKLKYLSVYC